MAKQKIPEWLRETLLEEVENITEYLKRMDEKENEKSI